MTINMPGGRGRRRRCHRCDGDDRRASQHSQKGVRVGDSASGLIASLLVAK